MNSNEKVARFQDRFAEALKIRGLKAANLSEMIDINRGVLSYYLSGKNIPKAERLSLICATLNVSEAWLLGYDVPMERIETSEIDGTRVITVDFESFDSETFKFGIAKSIDILLELNIPEETIKQLILKHFDIRYSEASKMLKDRKFLKNTNTQNI